MSKTSSLFGQNYAYGYGRVGVLQEYLLSQSDVDRLLASRDEKQLAHALTEMKMSTHVEYSADAHRFINNLERWIQHEVEAMVPEKMRRIFGILWLKNDASILAYLLKQHRSFTSDISATPEIGASMYDPQLMQDLVEGKSVADAPGELETLIRQVKEARGITPQEIDTRVAQFVVDMQVKLAKESGSREIGLYVAHHIDLMNIRTSRRLKKDENPADHLLRGGDIDITHFSLEPEQLASLVRRSSLPDDLAEDVLATGSIDSSVVLERGLARAIAHDIAVMRDKILSLEPIFAFAAIAQSQLKLLRTIIIGKATGLAVDEIRNLLPPFLSASPFA